MNNLNPINAILVAIFLIPIISGALKPFTRERIQRSLFSLFNNIEFLVGLIFSIYFTKKIFFDQQAGVYKNIYELIPENIRDLLYQKDVLTYIISVPVILMLCTVLIRIVILPIYRYVIEPSVESVFYALESMSSFTRRILGSLFSFPGAVFSVLLVSLFLNFFSYYFTSPLLSKWMNESQVYQLVYKNVLYPVMNSNIAKQIPVLVNDSFKKSIGRIIPDNSAEIGNKLAERLSGGNIRIIEYFNGVTLDEAIKSNEEIDSTAKKIVGSEKNTKKKAYLIYKWVSKNIKYDYEKAEQISRDTKGISSGSIIAFETRTGICFDYSSLYISMCRATGLKVRMVTGLGYSGVAWGDHAWNQVYSSEENRWINVDTTFGSTAGNYFDKPDFGVDHKYPDVQGEW